MTPGSVVGRYIVVRRVGAGAMGVVLSAFDPQLDRRVALKVLRSGVWSSNGSTSDLADEAKAMAKLSHPNVVPVHDVGMHEGQVFVAMEFIDGTTLRGWLRDRARPWSDVVPVCLGAGRGLAAAHDEGLVHGDFKPDNVMVGKDGRARVTDFGLARRSADVSAQGHDAKRTASGALVGTPVYMAPEQLAGLEATAASDQFGFCVAMYEALFGVRPFAGRSVAALTEAQLEGRMQPSPDGVRVPRWLLRVVTRGLSRDPAERFPDMHGLLAALERGLARRGRQRWIVVGAGLAAAVSVVPATRAWNEGRARIACTAEASEVAPWYGPERREAIVAAFENSGAPYAREVIERVPPRLDDYAASLAEVADEVCLATELDGRMPPARLEKARWCLAERVRVFEAFVVGLDVPEERTVRNAMKAVSGLRPVGGCVDERALDAAPSPPPTDVQVAMAPLRDRLAASSACAARGDHTCALEVVRAAMAEVVELGEPSLLADAQRRESVALAVLGRPAEAEGIGTAAYENAIRADHWAVAARAAAHQSQVVGYMLARHDEGEVWSELSRVAVERAGDADGLLEAQRQMDLGGLRLGAGRRSEAYEAFSNALQRYEAALPFDHPSVARARFNAGSARVDLGEAHEGIAMLEAALEAQEHSLGPSHPELADTLNNLGSSYQNVGRFDESRAACTRGLELIVATRGPEHPRVGVLSLCLGDLEMQAGDWAAAEVAYERARDVMIAAKGPDHPHIVHVHTALAGVAGNRGEFQVQLDHLSEARRIIARTRPPEDSLSMEIESAYAYVLREFGRHEDVLTIRQAVYDVAANAEPPDPQLGKHSTELGRALVAVGRADEAIPLLQRGLTLREEVLPDGHPHLAWALVGLGEGYLAAGDVHAALPHLRRALKIRRAAGAEAMRVGEAEFLLARALRRSGAEAEAEPLARAALDRFRATAHAYRAKQAEVWLGE